MTDIVLYYEKSNGDLYMVLRVTRGYFENHIWQEPEISLREILDAQLRKIRFDLGIDRHIEDGKAHNHFGKVHNHFYIGIVDKLDEIIQEFEKEKVRVTEGIPKYLRKFFQYSMTESPSHTQPTPLS